MMRNESFLSNISDLPQCFYHTLSETHICFWLGIGMTQAQAQMIVAEWYKLAYVTEAMKEAAFHDFCHAYLFGAFGNVSWRKTLESGANFHYNKLRANITHKLSMFDHDNHALKRYTVQQALRWFDGSDEQILYT